MRNWKFYYKEREYVPFAERVINTLILWSIIGLFWMSFLDIIGEHYPSFLTDAESTYGLTICWVLVLWGLYEVVVPRLTGKKWIWILVIPVGNVALFLGYFLLAKSRILAGLFAIINSYLADYNIYYGCNYRLAGGEERYTDIAFMFVAWILWYIIWNFAYTLNKKWVLTAFPIIAIALELSVGLSPTGIGVDYLFIGTVLLVAYGTLNKISNITVGNISREKLMQHRLLAKGVLLLLVIFSLVLSNLFYKDEMNSLIAKKQDLLKLQEQVLSGQTNIDIFGAIDIQLDKEVLDNRTPRYNGKEILTISTNQRPLTSIYLKGYQGTVYENSVWTGEYSYLKEACEEHNADVDDVSEALFQSGFDQIGEVIEPIPTNVTISYPYQGDWVAIESLGTLEPMRFTIEYNTNLGNVAYVPYFTDFTTLDQQYTLHNDGLLEKRFTDKLIVGQCLNLPESYNEGQYLVSEQWNAYSLGKYDWYDDVAKEEYLQVPKYLEDTLHEIVTSDMILLSDMPALYYGDEEFIESEPLYVADAVREFLATYMSYGLELDELPDGADPIEYFLTESHEGYCMHFASAGTMLLRYYGVPARYVSGYVVYKEAFPTETEVLLSSVSIDKPYTAVVKDNYAHAWVEVYVEGLGWVPVEMTPGYESDVSGLPTEPAVNEGKETESESEGTSSENSQEPESESEMIEPTESEEETEAEPADPTEEEIEPSEGGNEDEDDADAEGIRGWLGLDEDAKTGQVVSELFKKIGTMLVEVIKKLLPVLAVIAVGIAFYFGRKRWLMHYHSVLDKAVKHKHTRRAVKRIHRRMYGYLRIRKGFLKGLRDKEFEELLMETFTEVSKEDWHLYMEIAKKMHYSKEDISEEEMMHCYTCYKEVSKEFFKE